MLLEIALILPVLLYVWHWWARGYWRRRNVFQLDGEFIFGSTGRALFGNVDFFAKFYENIYRQYKDKKLIGFYNFYQPMLLVTDPEYIKQIFISDFNSFPSAGFDYRSDKLVKHNPFLFSGEKWKFYRGIHTMVLSQAKLKEHIPLFYKSSHSLINYIKANVDKPLKIGDLMRFYTIDNVTSAIYGLEPTAFTDPENGFRKHATYGIFDEKMSFGWVLAVYAPIINNILNIRFFSKQTEDFFVDMAKKTYSYRKQVKVSKNDLIEHLLKIDQKLVSEGKKAMDYEDVASHMMTVYGDAVETSSTLLSFLFLELANRPEIQERLREEIMSAGKELEDFDFEKMHSLEFLNMAFNEILRMHLLLPYHIRLCSQNTKIGDAEIQKGTLVFIPHNAIVNDPEYYPEPERFDPSRFASTNLSQIKGKYFPFGEGPKQCLGMRYATLQIKLAVVSMLLKFRLSPVNKMTGNKVTEQAEPHVFVRPDDNELISFEEL